MKIPCQACKPDKSGCYICGGYGYLIEQVKCTCGQNYWVRPGNFTVYQNKQWCSFDGHKLTFKGREVRCNHSHHSEKNAVKSSEHG